MPHRTAAILLTILAFAFFLRVLGQILVVLDLAPFLPPMQAWYSGLLPYPPLLISQFIILTLQTLISRDLWRNRGFFAVRRLRFGQFLFWFSITYFVVMLSRYIITMTLYPEMRWFTGTIPIFFHWVLAAWLYVWSRYHHAGPRFAPTGI